MAGVNRTIRTAAITVSVISTAVVTRPVVTRPIVATAIVRGRVVAAVGIAVPVSVRVTKGVPEAKEWDATAKDEPVVLVVVMPIAAPVPAMKCSRSSSGKRVRGAGAGNESGVAVHLRVDVGR